MSGSGRVLAVLEQVAAATTPPIRSELAASTGLARSTLTDIVDDLAALGYLRIGQQRVHPGPELDRWTAKMAARSSLRAQLRPLLRDLARDSGETAQLSVLGRARPGVLPAMFAIDGVESHQPVRYVFRPGPRPRFWPSSPGKVFLAFVPIHAAALPPQALSEEVAPAVIEAEAARVREQGYAWGRNVRGMTSIAAPLFDRAGALRAAITLAGPNERMTDPVGQFWPLLSRSIDQHRLR